MTDLVQARGTAEVEATVDYRVRFDESNATGVVRTSGLLRYAQDAAWIHSERLGYGRDWYAARGLAWLVRGVDLRVEGSASTGTTLSVRTEVIGFRRIWARRRTTIRSGELFVASLVTDWVLIDGAGQPTRIPGQLIDRFGGDGEAFTPVRVRLDDAPSDEATRLGFRVRPQDLDPMAHVNNATYLDYVEEAVAALPGGHLVLAGIPRRLRFEYLVAAAPDEDLDAWAWRTGPMHVAYRLTRSADRLELGRADLAT